MRWMLLPFVGALLSAQPRQWKPEELCAVEGRVLDAKTGDLLKKAQVSLRPETATEGANSLGVVTLADGIFALRDVKPGKYRLVAERSGYVAQAYGATRPGGPAPVFDLQPGA